MVSMVTDFKFLSAGFSQTPRHARNLGRCKGLKLTYHHRETLSFALGPYYGNLGYDNLLYGSVNYGSLNRGNSHSLSPLAETQQFQKSRPGAAASNSAAAGPAAGWACHPSLMQLIERERDRELCAYMYLYSCIGIGICILTCI